jgi:hypothetical protein
MSDQTTYDATRDPRTGRPVLPIDADNTRKAEAESLPLTDEDNQGIEIGDNDAVGEEDDLPREPAQSSVDVNATVPRMKAAVSETEESGDELTEEETIEEEGAEGQRPEALAKFAEVARNDDGKPVRNGTEATAETSPIPTDSGQKQDAATKVLREGVLKQDQGADEAIDRLPDRTAAGRHHPQGQ